MAGNAQSAPLVSYEKDTHVRSGWRAWYALAVLIVAVVFGFIDRQIIVLVVEPMKLDLALNDLQIGAINGLGPALFAVVAGYPLAWLADRLDRRWLLIACILFWSAATAARSFAGSFGELMIFTIGIAIGEAVLTPITYSLIPDLFKGKRRELANLIFFGAVVTGVGIALMLGGVALATVESVRPLLPEGLRQLAGWRIAFLLVALPGILVALAVVPIPAGRAAKPTTDPQSLVASKSLLRYLRAEWRTVGPIFAASGLYAFAFGSFSLWLPVAIIRELGASAHAVGVNYGLTFTIAAALGVVCAMVSAGFWRRAAGEAHILRALWVMITLALLPILALSLVVTPTQAYLLAGISILLLICGNAYSPTMLQNLSPPLLRARVGAVSMILYAAFGACGPMVIGFLSDGTDSGLMPIVAGLSAAAFAAAALLFRLAEKPYARTVQALAASKP